MNKFLPAAELLLARIEEPSTFAGGGIVAGLLAAFFKDDHIVAAILAFGSALGGLLAIVVPQPNRTTVVNNLAVSNTSSITLPHNSVTTITSNTAIK